MSTAGAIQFACGCGKKLTVKGEYAGKRVKCPACGQVAQVPADEMTNAATPARRESGPVRPPVQQEVTQAAQQSINASGDATASDEDGRCDKDLTSFLSRRKRPTRSAGLVRIVS